MPRVHSLDHRPRIGLLCRDGAQGPHLGWQRHVRATDNLGRHFRPVAEPGDGVDLRGGRHVTFWKPIETYTGSSPFDNVLIYGPALNYEGTAIEISPRPWLSAVCEADEDGMFIVEETDDFLVKPTHWALVPKP